MKEISEDLDMSYDTVDWNVRKLRTEGRIRHIGPAKGGHWDVIEVGSKVG